jgi:hypothetical protein
MERYIIHHETAGFGTTGSPKSAVMEQSGLLDRKVFPPMLSAICAAMLLLTHVWLMNAEPTGTLVEMLSKIIESRVAVK